MDQGNALINIGDLAKPAEKLVEKIADAVGILYEPRRVKNQAKAEAEAERIKRLEHIRTEFHERALIRLLNEELRNQENIDSVISKSLLHLKENADPEHIDNDLLAAFFEECKQVSTEEMQFLWGKLLAGEANSPGTFSKRTIKTVATLSSHEAELFSHVCRYVMTSGDSYTSFIYEPEAEIYAANGVGSSMLSRLSEIGLLQYENFLSFSIRPPSLPFTLSYGESKFSIEIDANQKFPIGSVGLTQIGAELASICTVSNVDGFGEYCEGHWTELGFKVKRVS
jgi:hypothetical protein